jgi:glycerol-3-phosphate acyltransferase PlsY
MNTIAFVTLLVIGYAFGSICSAILVSKLFQLPNPATEGSKNPGATNVLRLAGKKYALLVLLGDMLKGVLPVLLAKWLGASLVIQGYIACAAVFGHIFPIFFQFKGGKGVATALGALLALQFLLGLLIVAIWLITACVTRYSSLSSLVAFGLAPVLALFLLHTPLLLWPLLLISLLIFYKHSSNILRLFRGVEPKIKL